MVKWKEALWLAFDTEATGVSPVKARVFEVGFAAWRNPHGVTDRLGFLINPTEPIPAEVEKLTGVTNAMVDNRPDFPSHLPVLRRILLDVAPVLVGYNALSYDVPLVTSEFARVGQQELEWPPVIDPLVFARELRKSWPSYKLENVAQGLNLEQESAHRAVDDAAATLGVLAELAPDLPDDLGEVLERQAELVVAHEKLYQLYGGWVKEVEGEPGQFVIARGKHRGVPLPQVEPGYLKWMLKLSDLPEGTRNLVTSVLQPSQG